MKSVFYTFYTNYVFINKNQTKQKVHQVVINHNTKTCVFVVLVVLAYSQRCDIRLTEVVIVLNVNQ